MRPLESRQMHIELTVQTLLRNSGGRENPAFIAINQIYATPFIWWLHDAMVYSYVVAHWNRTNSGLLIHIMAKVEFRRPELHKKRQVINWSALFPVYLNTQPLLMFSLKNNIYQWDAMINVPYPHAGWTYEDGTNWVFHKLVSYDASCKKYQLLPSTITVWF